MSLDVNEGESIAIVGKSGSGKSTLMHVLALLDQPTEGVVELAGEDTRSLRGAKLNRTRNKTFGFVFQQFFLTPNASVLENVILPLKIAGVGARERKRRGLAALEQLELDDKARNKAVNLSGGQKQRSVIARALVNNPRVIFADEPTGNLDTATGAVVEDILFDLNREQGITLIVVTHDEELAARCDRRISHPRRRHRRRGRRHRRRGGGGMKTLDLIGTAIGNTFRSKTRTILTILAIFVGAFTLTITNGLGTGINHYIDDTVSAIGADDVMTVTKVSASAADAGDGPREYDPQAIPGAPVPGPPGSSSVVAPIGTSQLDELAAIDGVVRVQPVKTIDADYIDDGGTKYTIDIGGFVSGMRLQLAAGEQPDAAASGYEVVIPAAYVDSLGFADADAAVGQTVTLAVTDAEHTQHELEATVVGVAEESLGTSGEAVPNQAFTDALFAAQSTGLDAAAQDEFTQATVWFDPS